MCGLEIALEVTSKGGRFVIKVIMLNVGGMFESVAFLRWSIWVCCNGWVLQNMR